MKNSKIVLTDNPGDAAPEVTSRLSPCRIDGPFEEGRTCGSKSLGGKSDGGKSFGGKGGGAKAPGGKSFGAKNV